MHTYQPFVVSLVALEVEQLDGDGLRAEAGLDLLVDVALVDWAEPPFADEVGHGEVPGHGPELRDGEDVQVGARQRYRQILRRHHPAQAQVRERHPSVQRTPAALLPAAAAAPRRRRNLRLRLLLLVVVLLLGAAGGGGGGRRVRAEAAEQRAPRRSGHGRVRGVCASISACLL